MTPVLTVRIGNLTLANPVGLASGTFGYGSEYERLVPLDRIGALYTKAVTLEPRLGNNVPRIVETPAGMLNSIGLANPGLDRFVREKLPELAHLPCPAIVNVAGSTEDDYLRVVERLDETLGNGIAGFEINVSCPNVHRGGMSFGTDPALVERLTSRLRAATAGPLIVKLTPNVTDIALVAQAAEAGGADAISCINTLVGMVIDTEHMRPVLARGSGGLSGPAIRPIGVACVHRVHRAVRIPVIGIGGIMSAEDALQYLLAGATAVQIGTGTFVDPHTAECALDGIVAWMERFGVPDIASIGDLLTES